MEAVAERPAVRRWVAGPDWLGATVLVMASGPSMSEADAQRVRAWRTGVTPYLRRVIVINTTFRLAPWADVLYACDAKWWDYHAAEVSALGFCGGLWSIQTEARARHGVQIIESKRGAGLGREPGVINQGTNSGYQAINFAWQCGAARIVLLGFDMHEVGGRAHWHADHPGKIRRANPYAQWLLKFPQLASDLDEEGCEVVNCTPNSALRAFQQMPLDEALSHA